MLAVALLLVGSVALPWLPGVVLVLAIQTMFVYGLALGLGALNVYFRDVQHFIGIALQLWFYATPVIYDVSHVPQAAEVFGYEMPFRAIYQLNPMVRFVEAYRDLLYDLRFPPVADLAYMLGVSVVVRGDRSRHLPQVRAAIRGGAVSDATSGAAIVVDNVSKRFRLYHERNDSLKVVADASQPGSLRGVLGAQGRVARGPRRRHVRPDRRERLRARARC